MADGDLTSLAQATFDAQRTIFLHEFREFLARPSTPAAARAEEAKATISALKQIMTLLGMDGE